jgi:hypothetical protein
MFASPCEYKLHNENVQRSAKAFIRGLKEDDLFAGAMQADLVAILDAPDWLALFPERQHPLRLDRIVTGLNSYAVEVWRAAPVSGAPVFYKLLLRGGTQ